jgi:ribosomal protein S18 acetylase RimI-like enzyme
MKVRDACEADAARIAEISVRSWQEGYRELYPAEYLLALSVDERERRWRARLADPARSPLVLVCTAGSLVIGYLSGGEHRAAPPPGAREAEIYTLYVDPPQWGRGCGAALCQESFARFAAASFEQVVVYALAGNGRAHRFYEKIGFARERGYCGRFEMDGISLPDVRFRRPL